MIEVGIINISIGSLNSLETCLKNIGIASKFCNKPEELNSYKFIILPGIGNFGSSSKNLISKGWHTAIENFLANPEKKLLGICLGFQILFNTSDESPETRGLCLVKGKIEKLQKSPSNRVPHVGWNNVSAEKKNSFLNFINCDLDVYFVHSYGLILKDKKQTEQFDEYTITKHGKNLFVSSFRIKNIYGCQFHPEKSSKAGIKFLKSFLDKNA